MADTVESEFLSTSRSNEEIGRFEKAYFSEGSVRYAFVGSTKQDDDEQEKVSVLKMFKTVKSNTFKNWKCDIDACSFASGCAEKFCNLEILHEQKNQITFKKIEFVLPKMVNIEGYHHSIACCMQYVCKRFYSYVAIVEPYLSGSYFKFSDNYGYENDSVDDADILFAFSHWTYQDSNCEFMVSDLQGIEMEEKYILTDPAVHSIKQVYGVTDLGYTGMQKVLHGHTCNNICKSLGLKQIENKIPAQIENQKTRLTSELTKDEMKSNEEHKKSLKKGGTLSNQSNKVTKNEKKTNAVRKKTFKNRCKTNRQSKCSCIFKGQTVVFPKPKPKLNGLQLSPISPKS